MKIFAKRTVRIVVAGLLVSILGACNLEDIFKNGATVQVQAADPVEVVNTAPIISGNPLGSTKVGDTYSFVPTVIYSDSDALQFNILNQPAWADFDTATGEMSGNPQQEHVGVYANIIITASDGALSASLEGFSVDVVHVGITSATLSWIPPTENADNSYLTNLAGYKIYYGLSEGNYPNVIVIDNPGIATFVVENLTPATYFFVTTAFNSDGVESEFSNVVIKEIS